MPFRRVLDQNEVVGERMGKASSSNGQDLHAAARSGDLNSLQLMLTSNPLAVNSRDKHSRTPLHLAAWSGQTEVVNYLCKNKADVGAAAVDDMGAIHFAAQKGHLEIVRTLLSSGVSIKTCNRKGFTPLHYAVQGSHIELIKYLVRKGASLSAKTKAGKTPLDLAGSEEIRSLLVECGKSSKVQSEEGSPKKGDVTGEAKTEESDPVPTSGKCKHNLETLFEKPEHPVETSAASHDEGHNDGKSKRNDDDFNKEALPEPKKARIALNHLLRTDDTEEENL